MIAKPLRFFANRHNLMGLRRFAKNRSSAASANLRPNGFLQFPLKVKWFGYVVVSVLGYLAMEQLIDLHTKGFCFQKILADDLPFQPEWELSPLSDKTMEEIDQVLNQPFTLIGSGSECFVFISADQETVLKCFKIGFARPVYYRKGLLTDEFIAYAGTLSSGLKGAWIAPFDTLRRRIYGIREFRLFRTFTSCKIAYEHLREETGILYLHLNPTHTFHRALTLIDRNGAHYSLPIDTAKFLLQRRVTLLEPHFKKLLKEGRLEDIKESIDSLIGLIDRRCLKGFSDRDFINRNVGYRGNVAIEIDLGSFAFDPAVTAPEGYRQELLLATTEFSAWLKKHAPEWTSYLSKLLEDRLAEQTDDPFGDHLDSNRC